MPDWQDKLALIARRNRQEIVEAKLSRREMMRLGLLTSAGTLVLKSGLSSRAAYAKDPPASPATTPFVQAMPILPTKYPVRVDQLTGGAPTGKTPCEACTHEDEHQRWTQNPAQEYYEFFVKPGTNDFYKPDRVPAGTKAAPAWQPTNIWGFDGRYPGARIMARYGTPVMVRHHNELPSEKTHKGFGIPRIATHLHNAHTPSESDGNPLDYIYSKASIADGSAKAPSWYKGFKDQHYPNIYAGGDEREALGSLWFHDHTLDFTAQNVVKGLVGCYNLFDEKDSGSEATGFKLPSGEFDVPIFFGDFSFDRNFQVVFDLFNSDGILGDKFCANGVIQPYFDVKRRRYRLRLYNHGPSRFYEFALYDGKNYLPFWQISNDGNLLPEALEVTKLRLSVAERADIIVDFGKLDPSKSYYLVNRLEQDDGRGPDDKILTPGTPIIKFNLVGNVLEDSSVDPGSPGKYNLAAGPNGKLKLRDLPDIPQNLSSLKTRSWRFERTNGGWAVNGKLFDEKAVSASIPEGTGEVWTIQNPGGGWSHPIHMHFEEHRILSRNGRATSATSPENSRKDVIWLGPNEEVKVFMRFRDIKGRYVMHCHNVVHEDSGMMVRWDIV